MLSIQSNDYKNALLGKPSSTSIGKIIDAEFDEATIKLQTYLKKFRVQDTNENEFTWSFDENFLRKILMSFDIKKLTLKVKIWHFLVFDTPITQILKIQ